MSLWSLGIGLALLLAACYLFLGISILCDEHLCPSLDKLCAKLRMPTALAAATFLSFGSSAPEIIIAASGAAGKETELSIPAVLVSALIAFGAIPPAVVWASGEMTLRAKEVLRDAISYAVGLTMVIFFNMTPKIGPFESLALLLSYFVYLGIVRATSDMSQICEDDDEEADPEEAKAAAPSLNGHASTSDGDAVSSTMGNETSTSEEMDGSSNPSPSPNFRVPKTISEASTAATLQTPTGSLENLSKKLNGLEDLPVATPKSLIVTESLPKKQSRLLDLEASYDALLQRIGLLEKRFDGLLEPMLETSEKEDEEEEESAIGKVLAILGRPFDALFKLTIPDGVVARFATSLTWLAVLAYSALSLAEQVSRIYAIQRATAGATLLAWGGQMPDAIAAVALAKSGEPDAAISQAIASQVINVTLGLGLPFLLYFFAFEKPVYTSNHSTVLIVACSVLCSIVAYLLAMAPLDKWREWRACDESTWTVTLGNKRAAFLALTFTVFYAGSIVIAQIPAGADELVSDVTHI